MKSGGKDLQYGGLTPLVAFMEYGGSTPFSTTKVQVSEDGAVFLTGLFLNGNARFGTAPALRVSPELRWSRTASSRRTP
jgi:uncharacterized protein with beta-barrel porin domain